MASTSATVTLIVPVDFEGTSHATIELKRLKGRHLRAIDQESGDAAKALVMIQKSSGWPPEAVDELDAADIEAIGKKMETLMGKSKG